MISYICNQSQQIVSIIYSSKLFYMLKQQLGMNLQQQMAMLQQRVDAIEKDKLLTVKEFCELLSVKRNTFDRWEKDGIIPVYRIGLRKYCKKSELMQVLEKGQTNKLEAQG